VAGAATWGLTYVINQFMFSRFLMVLGSGSPVGPIGRMFRYLVQGTNLDQAAVYTWFLAASILLALVGAVLGMFGGVRARSAELKKLVEKETGRIREEVHQEMHP
jgi:hypothetical protein